MVGAVVGLVVGVVLLVCRNIGGRLLILGIPGGLEGFTVSKQFICAFSFAANGLKANEHR